MKASWQTFVVASATAMLVFTGCGKSDAKPAKTQANAPGAKAQAAADARAKALTAGVKTPGASAQPAQPAQPAQTAPAAAAPVWRTAQHRTVVTSNLKQVGMAITMYAGMHDETCPPDLTALARENPGLNRLLVAPYDRGRRSGSDSEIGADNSSIVYLGKGVRLNAVSNPGTVPVAFEKPDLQGPNGECFVLYCDGHAELKNVRGKTCRAIAEELLVSNFFPARQTILDNAAAADGAR